MAKNIKNGNKKSSVNDAFEGAKAALPIFIDEYTKECDRKNVIESKITTLLTIEIAVLTVFIPIIPFENIHFTISLDAYRTHQYSKRNRHHHNTYNQ